MTPEQITSLKASIEQGNRVFWVMDDIMDEIVSVGIHPQEPSAVGYSHSGNYIGLYNVDPEDLWVACKLFT